MFKLLVPSDPNPKVGCSGPINPDSGAMWGGSVSLYPSSLKLGTSSTASNRTCKSNLARRELIRVTLTLNKRFF